MSDKIQQQPEVTSLDDLLLDLIRQEREQIGPNQSYDFTLLLNRMRLEDLVPTGEILELIKVHFFIIATHEEAGVIHQAISKKDSHSDLDSLLSGDIGTQEDNMELLNEGFRLIRIATLRALGKPIGEQYLTSSNSNTFSVELRRKANHFFFDFNYALAGR